MKIMRHIYWVTFVAFVMVQLLPNILFHPFIFHEISQLLPDIFTLHGRVNHQPVSGLSYGFSLFFRNPLDFSCDFPVMALALVWPFLFSSRLPCLSRFLVQPLLGVLGIVAGYLIEVLSYDLRVLHGKPDDYWWEGVLMHRYHCFWTVVSILIVWGFSLLLSLVVRHDRLSPVA